MAIDECNVSQCFLCNHCSKEWRELIALKKKTFVLKKGASIFRQGDPVQGIYFIYEGSAKIHAHWDEEKELIVRFACKGSVVGHRGLGHDPVYPVSATTLEPSKVCYVDHDFFLASLDNNPRLSRSFLEFYEDELPRVEKRMKNLAHMPVKGRVALALLDIADIFGTDEQGTISNATLRQDIASYAGTTYETVFKLMQEFTSSKIISAKGKSITIHQMDALRKMADN
jgi:CRP/FNR family transcriptional regulator